MQQIHATTVLAVLHNGQVAIGADGQATMGNTVAKSNVKKIRKLSNGKIITGFAGSTADAFSLLERFEEKLAAYGGNMKRAAIELAKDWRTDRMLRRLEALMIVANSTEMFLLSGNGDVIEPDEGVAAIGSGGTYAQAAATALYRHTDMNAPEIAEQALRIASSICIYTNDNITIEVVGSNE